MVPRRPRRAARDQAGDRVVQAKRRARHAPRVGRVSSSSAVRRPRGARGARWSPRWMSARRRCTVARPRDSRQGLTPPRRAMSRSRSSVVMSILMLVANPQSPSVVGSPTDPILLSPARGQVYAPLRGLQTGGRFPALSRSRPHLTFCTPCAPVPPEFLSAVLHRSTTTK